MIYFQSTLSFSGTHLVPVTTQTGELKGITMAGTISIAFRCSHVSPVSAISSEMQFFILFSFVISGDRAHEYVGESYW